MATVRARDLRTNIKDMGFERGIVATLELALEELGELRQHMRELTDLADRCTTELMKLTTIADGMRGVVDQMRRDRQQEIEDGKSHST